MNLHNIVRGAIQAVKPDSVLTLYRSLPGAPVGNAGSAEEYAKYAGVFYPHLIYRDKGHDILVPPAADVSNTFVKKFQGGMSLSMATRLAIRLSRATITNFTFVTSSTYWSVLSLLSRSHSTSSTILRRTVQP